MARERDKGGFEGKEDSEELVGGEESWAGGVDGGGREIMSFLFGVSNEGVMRDRRTSWSETSEDVVMGAMGCWVLKFVGYYRIQGCGESEGILHNKKEERRFRRRTSISIS